MKPYRFLLALFCAWSVSGAVPEDAAPQELRAVREKLLAAMNHGDLEGGLLYLHPKVVVTWQGAEVSRGREEVRAYLTRTLSGPSKTVEKFTAEVKVDDSSLLDGGTTATAFGSAMEHFTTAGARGFDLPARWTATLVKEDEKWLVASLHTSGNLFDNPMLTRIRDVVPWVGGGSFALGMVFGWLISRRFRRA